MKRRTASSLFDKIKAQTLLAQTIFVFSKFKPVEQAFLAYLAIVAILVIFFSMVVFEPLSWGNPTYFWLLSGEFATTGIVFLVIFLVVLLFNASFRFKSLIHELLGLKDQDGLFNFICLWVLTTLMIGLQDALWIAGIAGSTLSLTTAFYVLQFLLISGMIYTLVVSFQQWKTAHKKNQVTNIHYEQHDSSRNHKDGPVQTLFE